MTHDLNKVPDGIIECGPTGSRYICSPAPMDTDEDYVVLVRAFTPYAQSLLDDGWNVHLDDAEYENPSELYPFITARKGEMNLIIYRHEDGYRLFSEATATAKRLNIMDKQKRIDLFKMFLEQEVFPCESPL